MTVRRTAGMGMQDDPPHPVLVLGAAGGQGGAVAAARRRYQADIRVLRQDYPPAGWTSFTTWAERAFRPGAPVSHASH